MDAIIVQFQTTLSVSGLINDKLFYREYFFIFGGDMQLKYIILINICFVQEWESVHGIGISALITLQNLVSSLQIPPKQSSNPKITEHLASMVSCLQTVHV